MTKLTSWTNYPIKDVKLSTLNSKVEIKNLMSECSTSLTPRGNGRCYGDASLGDHVVSINGMKKILKFDSNKGIIHCEAGILLSEILEYIVPKGWFLPVTPGTKYITVGGAIASNVHGKNHHKDGAISNFIESMELIQPNGKTSLISLHDNSELFALTCGGMGMTGIIVNAMIRLKAIETSFINYRSIKASNLKEVMNIFDNNKGVTYSMAWIDCLQKGCDLGRSIVMLGEHAAKEEVNNRQDKLKFSNSTLISIPFSFPNWVLNPLSIKAFNFLYFHKQFKKEGKKVIHFDGFFYPLDAILNWNRMYGKKGFIQYQPVFPLKSSYDGISALLKAIAKKGMGSFLAVLKLMGEEDNDISFPMKGYTLALDFSIQKGLFEFLEELDQIVLKYGGRLYLSKDARMQSEMYEKSYKKSGKIRTLLKKYDEEKKITSYLNERLKLK
ncbi:MAG: FAD-binding oxidoreductase [Reichenbachiella sp.]